MNWLRLALFLMIGFLPALSGFFVRPGEWYASLSRPSFTPPSWVFGPVWTLLYATIGVAGYLAWSNSRPGERALPFTVYGAQLVTNALWTLLFFGLHRMGIALVDIALLFALIVANVLLFLPLSRAAGLLLLPYLLWVGYATALNYSFWRMNS